MADERSKVDVNRKAAGVIAGYAHGDAIGAATPTIVVPRINTTTSRLLVDASISNYTGVVDGETVSGTDTGTLILGTDGSNYQILKVNSDGELAVNLETSDIQIGSVELKDADSAALANIKAANTGRSTATVVLATQPIDATGAVLSTSALATSAKQLADGHNVTVDNTVGSGVYVRPGTSATFTVDLGTNNDVTIDNSSIVHLEDVAHSTGDAGIMTLAVENEDGADLSTGDKDYTPIAVTKEGNVIVKQEGTIAVTESTPLTGFATSALQLADGHAVTIDNISTNEVYVRGSGTAGSADAAVLTVQGIASGTALAVTESAPLSGFATSAGQLADGHNVTVDNVGGVEVIQGTAADLKATVTQASADRAITAIVPGVAATSLGKAEDAGHTSGDTGVMMLAVRNDSLTILAGTDLDYVPLTTDAYGNLMCTVYAQGDLAHDAGDSGNPVKIGGRAQDIIGAEPEEVTADDDRVDALFDMSGRLGVTAGSDYKFADINDSTSGNNTIIAAQAAGKRIAVWAILIVSDGTTDVRWENGAGGTAFTGQVPLQAREGYSISAGGLVPLFVTGAATLLNLELTAAVNVHGFVSYTVLED